MTMMVEWKKALSMSHSRQGGHGFWQVLVSQHAHTHSTRLIQVTSTHTQSLGAVATVLYIYLSIIVHKLE